MVSRCAMAAWFCIIFSSWFSSFGAMAICMITLDQSVTGTYFWNYVGNRTDSADDLNDEVRAKTVSDTQIIGRVVLYFGASTSLAVMLTWICTIRKLKSDEAVETECKYNRNKVNALSDHVTNGKTRVIVENMSELLRFILEVKAGNDRCELLLNAWYRAYMRTAFARAYHANPDIRTSDELQNILLELLEGYRAPQNEPQRAIEYRVTLV